MEREREEERGGEGGTVEGEVGGIVATTGGSDTTAHVSLHCFLHRINKLELREKGEIVDVLIDLFVFLSTGQSQTVLFLHTFSEKPLTF